MRKSETLKKIINYFESLPNNQLHIEKLESKRLFLPSMVSVSINYRGNYISGSGQAEHRDKATFIAFMEVLERMTLLGLREDLIYSKKLFLRRIKKTEAELIKKFPLSKNWIGTSSNGWAIHSNRQCAKENAIKELIERHVILKSLLSEIPPAKVKPPEILSKYTIPLPMTYDFYAWSGPLGRYVVLMKCQLHDRSIYGIGCGKTLERAKKAAFFEASPRIAILHRSSFENLFVVTPSQNFLYHWYEDTHWTEEFFNKTASTIPTVDSHILYKDFWLAEPTQNKFLKSLNLHIIKAVCPKVQTLFSGHWDSKYMNPKAVEIDAPFPLDMHMIG